MGYLRRSATRPDNRLSSFGLFFSFSFHSLGQFFWGREGDKNKRVFLCGKRQVVKETGSFHFLGHSRGLVRTPERWCTEAFAPAPLSSLYQMLQISWMRHNTFKTKPPVGSNGPRLTHVEHSWVTPRVTQMG